MTADLLQIDLEMSFATGEDVMNIIESMMRKLWHRLINVSLSSEPFTRMTYEQAMSTYGSDKPDLRFDAKVRIAHEF